MDKENEVLKTEPVLSVRGLSKHLGGRLILNKLDFDVYPGEIFGFLGPNGSGKTTTIKLILGLLRMEEGSVSICGHDNVKDFEAAVANAGGIVENPELYRFLTGRENLIQFARMDGGLDDGRVDELARTVHLEGRMDDKVAKYSLGMRQRLGVAQAILNHPKILILDEPTNGLDPVGIKDLRELLLELAHKEKLSVFISSHLLSELDMLCDRIAILNHGSIINTMTIDEVRNAGNGGTPEVLFELDPESCVNIPAELQPRFTLTEDGRYRILMPKAEIPGTIKTLDLAGVRIFSVECVKHSLEEIFISLTDEKSSRTESEGGLKK